jgi:SHS2 domain-containing protein
MRYEFLEHTADAKFKAYGETIEEAFSNAALATFSILIEPGEVKPAIEKKISLDGKKLVSLLYDFLEELLFFLDVDGFILNSVKSIEIKDDLSLECSVLGDNYKGYDVSGNVKSVTYNDMEIKKTNSGYELTVVVDL